MSRRRAVVPALALALLAAAATLTRAASPASTPAAPRLAVAVTVPAQEWLVRRLAGDGVDVEVLLPPGASEHTYEPTPRQVARVASARLLVEVGHPALLFERRLLASLPVEGRRTSVRMMAGVVPVPSADGDPAESDGDPHVWLSPAAMRSTAIATAAALRCIEPAQAARVDERLRGLLAEIDATAADVRATLAGLQGRRVYLDHPAWAYLLHDAGITQVAIEAEGKEPSARQLVALIEQARRDRVRVVFTQRGLSDRAARVLADEIHAQVVTIDALADDWPASLRRTARLFAAACRGAEPARG